MDYKTISYGFSDKMARQKKRNIQIFSGNFKKKEIGILNYWRLPGQHSWPIRPFAHEETLRRVPILFREEFCRYMIVAFLEDGHLDYFCDGKEYHLSAGDLIVIPSGSTYRFQTTHPHFYHKKVIEFKGVNLVSICETLGLNKVHCLSLDTPEEFLGLFHEIGSLIQSREPKNIPLLLGKCHELLSFLSFRISAVRQTRNLLNTIVERLEHDLDEPLQIRDLSAELHMSVSGLEKLFKRKFRMTPGEYRQNCRVEQAKYLLKHTENSLKEIAYQLGYCNPYYFSSEFRRMTGFSPSSFRKTNFD